MAVIQQTTSLTPSEWYGVQCVARQAAKYRDELPSGKGQAVDMLLRIQGVIDVAEDGVSRRTNKPSAELIMAHVLRIMDGLVKPTNMAELMVAIRGAAENGELPESDEAYQYKAAEMIRTLSTQKEIPRKGAVTGSFQIGQVKMSGLSSTASSAVAKATRAIVLEEAE